MWHFPNRIHQWDTFHYYVGSKYFKELSYDRLYECVAVADSEAPGLRRRVELRKVMNLRTNMMEGTQHILAHPEECKGHFTTAALGRLQARRRPLPRQARRQALGRGADRPRLQRHAGLEHPRHLRCRTPGPRSDGQIDWLTWIDPLFIVGLTLMSWWAFGWRTTCVALAVFATNFPSRFYWTGGAFLRWDWLFYFVGGVCLVKKERTVLGGFFLGYSTLLRIFPLFIFIGPLLMIAVQMWGKQSPDRPWWKPEPLPPPPDGDAEARRPFAPVSHAVKALLARTDRRYLSIILGAALAVGDADAAQPRDQQRRRRLQGVHLQHAQAQGDAAHQPHGAADGRHLQPVRGGPVDAERARRGSVGPVEAREGRDVQAARPALPAVRRRVRRDAVRGASQQHRAVGRAARWAR